MSLPWPAVSAARPGRDGLWSRRLLSLVAGGAVAAVAAGALLPMTASDLDDVRGAVWVATAVHLAQQHWRPRRTGRLAWCARVAGRHGTEPGLVARRSPAGWVGLVAGVVVGTTLSVGTISILPNHWAWVGAARPVLLAVVALGLGRVAYREVRFTGRLALTASGIRQGRRWYGWTNIDRVGLHRRDGRVDGVRLRQIVREPLEPAPVIGGRSVAVSDERLLAAIEHLRPRPEVLAVGLPVSPPEPAVRPAGG
ncbi:MAG TPA: hypothetical protein VF462_05835 [Micromonosporaceae bacterium]